MTRRPVRRVLAWSAALAAIALAAVAALHAPPVMRLFGGGGAGGGCPFGAERAAGTPEQRDASRKAALVRLKGTGDAPARPAGDFALGVTTRADLLAWAGGRGADCRPGRDRQGLECDVGREGARAVVYADFDRADRLVGLMSMSYSRGAEEAGSTLAAASAALQGAVGAPTRATGEGTPAYLSAGPLRQARAEYRRANYFASLSATNMGPGGYLVSQVYQALD
ncbi:MAG TPA: hypothetical protein VNO33_06005 [Kofleriaceae bacterium]|nr:hypothetical protein [Kofleriaceae bacterium]